MTNDSSRSITPSSPRDVANAEWQDDTRHYNGNVMCTYDSGASHDPWLQSSPDERSNLNYSHASAWNPIQHPNSMNSYDSRSYASYGNHDGRNAGGDFAALDKLAEQFQDFKLKPQILKKRLSDRKIKANLKKPACQECVFCKNNEESEKVYKSHVLKDVYGRVQCPVLRLYRCPICDNPGGDKAHTIRYCPKGKSRLGKMEMMDSAKKIEKRTFA